MQLRTSKTLALLGGVATLALGSSFMLRLSAPKAARQVQGPCAPRMFELEQSACEPLVTKPLRTELAELSIHTH
jgi:hypothetical protein